MTDTFLTFFVLPMAVLNNYRTATDPLCSLFSPSHFNSFSFVLFLFWLFSPEMSRKWWKTNTRWELTNHSRRKEPTLRRKPCEFDSYADHVIPSMIYSSIMNPLRYQIDLFIWFGTRLYIHWGVKFIHFIWLFTDWRYITTRRGRDRIDR